MGNNVLPLEVKAQLQALDQEYKDGEWTRKGFMKHQHMLLEPYTDVLKEWKTQHQREVEQQRQLSANSSEMLSEKGLEQSESVEARGGGGGEDGGGVSKGREAYNESQGNLSPPSEGGMEDGTHNPPPPGRKLLSWRAVVSVCACSSECVLCVCVRVVCVC